MDIQLNPIEARVLGALIEKAVTTPEYYPLTLNGLTAACNQKSNRDPVMALEEKEVVRALDRLRDKGLAVQKTLADARVPKYGHTIEHVIELSPAELAALCVLLLRGPQTPGEVRGRTGRLHEFHGLAEVEATLDGLASRLEGPLVIKMPRQPGRREHRYAHLLCGEVELDEAPVTLPPEPATRAVRADDERIATLEQEVATLREAVAELQRRFAEFARQFE
ncbi:MAG: YceH family protein [Nitrospirota bacterium]|jgi:uncharacterized protein YceH (UPF0502 family)